LSKEYLPGPVKYIVIKAIKYIRDFSFLEKGSPSCVIAKATSIVKAGKILNNLVFHPIIIKIGAMNSPKDAKISDGVTPIPSGSPNLKFP
jgi:hypothetical protein